ncbi:MAG: aminopeptidase, partial [Bacilli bacterium]|nr:aminopeptidase [Bacilli bacterium]
MEEKYIDLLLERCVSVADTKKLFVSYDAEHIKFVKKLVEKAKLLGANDIYLQEDNAYQLHELLKVSSIDDIKTHSYFDGTKWDEYALKGASFVVLKTEHPGLMDDIDTSLIAATVQTSRMRKKVYKKMQNIFEIPWVIALLPSKMWADKLFPGDAGALERLRNVIYTACMVNTKDPIESWNTYLKNNEVIKKTLNNLEIDELIYQNSLGTNLKVKIPDGAIWTDINMDRCIPNMPSYEIFTAPNCFSTEGIVYSSKPLVYGGGVIEDFYFEFKEGKVINYDAKKGKDILSNIFYGDSNARYLGEVALVNYDSPISNRGITFGNTLFDENSSCHLALGQSFSECIINGQNLSNEELYKLGINSSTTHIDFMIGTKDLQ